MKTGFLALALAAFSFSAYAASPITKVGASQQLPHGRAVLLVGPRVATGGGLFPVSAMSDLNLVCRAFGYQGMYFDRQDRATFLERGRFAMAPGGPAMYVVSDRSAQLNMKEESYLIRVACAR
jgi:hypothetical protein